MDLLKQKKRKKYLIAGAVTLAIAVLAAAAAVSTVKVYASEDYWDVRIGDKTAAVLTSESSAKQVIRNVKNHYVQEGAVLKSIKCTPEMKVVKTSYRVSDHPKVSDVAEAVDYILTGTKTKKTYTVKNGDSLWSIAKKNGLTVRQVVAMNEDKDFGTLLKGDKIRLYEMKPMVNVDVQEQVVTRRDIKYDTVTQTSADALKNTTVVKQKGVNGRKEVTELVTTRNGKVTESREISSKVVKSPKNKIIVKGTGTLSAPTGGKTYPGNGADVAQYALQFVGNPYVYGGVSLTNGADCSGFVLSVYSRYGITMAHDAGVMRSYGREVSLAAAQPGDLVCYYGHVGIYIGGGQLVHAVNENMGIAVTGTDYIGPVMTVRRIVE